MAQWKLHEIELVKSLSEAVIVAGLLALFVDPFIKNRLVEDSAKDTFQHLIGFSQHPAIKARLRQIIQNTKLYLMDFHVSIRLIPENGHMRVDCSYSFTVVNPTNQPQPYQHFLGFEMEQNPTVHQITMISAKGNINFETKLREPDQEPGVLHTTCKKTHVPPENQNASCRFLGRYSLVYPEQFFHTINFMTPTIGVLLSFDIPEGWTVTATPTRLHDANSFEYPELFMLGQFVTFRWRRQPSNHDPESKLTNH
jgi:hypothetical protein